MREIKFRGKEIGGEWVYGDLLRENDNRFGGQFFKIYVDTNDVEDEGELIRVDGSTIGQYTGLKDKKGVEIYEGDILGMPEHKPENWSGDVYFKEGAFFITPNGAESLLNNYRAGRSIIIGNIHSNPELLK